MESLIIEKTNKSPLISMMDGHIHISGRSIPQNSRKLYQPTMDWAKKYVETPQPKTIIDLNYEYIDTSSIRCLIDVLKIFDECYVKEKNEIEINWYSEEGDDDMNDLGVYLKTYLRIPFNFIPTSSDDEQIDS
jgi:hypothetical protein